nr:hypothetical protein Iba_chr04fCG10170 [Ipomoea batatas]
MGEILRARHALSPERRAEYPVYNVPDHGATIHGEEDGELREDCDGDAASARAPALESRTGWMALSRLINEEEESMTHIRESAARTRDDLELRWLWRAANALLLLSSPSNRRRKWHHLSICHRSPPEPIGDLGSKDTFVNSSMATRKDTLRKCFGSGLGGAGKGDMEARQESGCRVTAHTAVELEETGGDDVEGERDGCESPPRSEWEWCTNVPTTAATIMVRRTAS